MSRSRGRFIRALDLSALGAALCGFLALGASGEVLTPVLVVITTLMMVSALRDRLPWRPSDRFWAWGTAFMLGFSFAMWWFFAGDPLVPIILFTAYLLVMRLHTARQSRHVLQIFIISFGMLVLASALTTSLLFLPLCLLYVFCALHGIVLLTMRREAERTGAWPGRSEARMWTSPALPALERLMGGRFTRTVAGVTAGLLLVAGGFFFMLPRYEGRDWFRGLRPSPGDQTGMPVASGGGEDSVALGQISQIRLDHSIVMRVSLPEEDSASGPPIGSLRLRGQALAQFDGQRWHSLGTLISDINHPGQPLRVAEAGLPTLVQEVAQDRGAPALLYGAPTLLEFVQRGQRAARVQTNMLEDWVRVGTESRLSEPFTYRVHSQLSGPGPHAGGAGLLPSGTSVAQAEGELLGQVAEHYRPMRRWRRGLALFSEMDAPPPDVEMIRSLAAQWAIEAGVNHPITIADEFQRRLRTEFEYTLNPDVTTPDFPVRGFLEDTRAGHCEYFGTAMVLMLRSLGIPARLVTGYLTPEWNASGDFFVVRESHAHAWVEVFADHDGWHHWVTYDPTPAGGLPQAGRITMLAQVSHWLDAHRFTWYKWVIDLDEMTQRRLYRRLGMDEWRGAIYRGIDRVVDGLESPRSVSHSALAAGLLLLPIGAALAAVLIWMGRRGGRAAPARVNRQPTPYYRQLLRWLARRGHRRRPSQAPGEFASAVIAEHPEWGAVAEITAIHCRERFGGRPLPAEERARVEGLLASLLGRA